MAKTENVLYRNLILRGVVPEDLALLAPLMKRQELKFRRRLEGRRELIRDIYFIETGVASVIAHIPQGRDTEVGLIGFEGMTGFQLVLGDDRSINECVMQIPGSAMRISAEAFSEVLDASPTLRLHLLRFVQAAVVQSGFTALANARSGLEERLARWILMCHDRMEGDTLALTHDYISIMLGVRRPGVTIAMQLLEGRGLIRATRGLIEILDREGLEMATNGCYGEPEAEYVRLMAKSVKEDALFGRFLRASKARQQPDI